MEHQVVRKYQLPLIATQPKTQVILWHRREQTPIQHTNADRRTQVMIGAASCQLTRVIQTAVKRQSILKVDRQRRLYFDVVPSVLPPPSVRARHPYRRAVSAKTVHGRCLFFSLCAVASSRRIQSAGCVAADKHRPRSGLPALPDVRPLGQVAIQPLVIFRRNRFPFLHD